MANALIAWGLVFLVGMLATHYSGVDLWQAWVAWLVIFFFGNMMVGKHMKKMPKQLSHMWIVVNVLGALLTIAFLAGTIEFDATKLMAIWFFIMGSAVFAGSHFSRDPEGMFIGFLWVAVGITLPLWFASVPFLIGGLVFGLPFVIGGLMKK